MTSAPITFFTGGSGGLGKSSSARAVAEALGRTRLRTVLVDGNPGQQSQRAFLALGDSAGLERAAVKGLKAAWIRPGAGGTGASFALLPGPLEPRAPGINDLYGSSLVALRGACDIVIVDADRVDGSTWNDPATFAGGVMRPFVQSGGARIVFKIGQTGSQLDDGLAALDAIRRPSQTLVVAQVPGVLKPHSDQSWERLLDGMGMWGGSDVWDEASAKMLDARRPGYDAGAEPDWLRRAAVFAGGRRDDFKAPEKRSWFHRK